VRSVGCNWKVLSDTGFGYFEPLENLWTVQAQTLRKTLASQWHSAFHEKLESHREDWLSYFFN
jgi:hypothetical protein